MTLFPTNTSRRTNLAVPSLRDFDISWRSLLHCSYTLCRKDEGHYFSRNFVCILSTTTTRHMVSFIDFFSIFWQISRPKPRPICSLYLLMLWNRYVTQTASLGYPWFAFNKIFSVWLGLSILQCFLRDHSSWNCSKYPSSFITFGTTNRLSLTSLSFVMLSLLTGSWFW